MARRALLTEGEREALRNPENRENPYVAVSRVRKKLEEELPEDVEILREHADKHGSDLFETLQEAVCEDGAREDIATRDVSREPETVEPDRRGDREPEPQDDLAAVVDRVADRWDDPEDRLEARKAAARAVLRYAREHGGVSKQEAKEEVYPEYPVEGQNERTWYRKNIRPVLNEAAEYDQSERQYDLKIK